MSTPGQSSIRQSELARAEQLSAAGCWQDASEAWALAIRGAQGNAKVHANHAQALAQCGRYAEAVDAWGKALENGLPADEVAAGLGIVFCLRQQYDIALENLQMAVSSNPENLNAWSNLVLVCVRLGRIQQALAAADHVLAIDPDNLTTLSSLGTLCKDIGLPDDAMTLLRRAHLAAPDKASILSNLLWAMLHADNASAQDILNEARAFDRLMQRKLNAAMSSSPYPQRASTASRKLRVGWVSSDLRRHAVGYFVVPVLEQLAHANIELLLYYNNTQDDDMSRRARATASVWRETAQLSDTQLAGQIRNDAPDILIDLGGHTEGSRIEVFAQRLAPVQITWLGFPGTSGLANMYYIFVPPDAELLKGHWCSEKPLVLPGCYGAREAAHIPVLASYEAPCLRTGFIQFGCLNNFAKVSPLAVKTWASILLAVDDARLTLVVTNADDPGVHDEITGRFAALGVDPSRLDLISRMPPEDYLACYRKIDIALDSLPFNGGTTGLDALSMSTPFITLEGDALHSRMGANLLRTVQEDALIARSPEEYIDKTIALTKDRARLISLHSNLRLRLQDSALLDVASFAQGMQHVLETTAARHGISTQQ